MSMYCAISLSLQFECHVLDDECTYEMQKMNTNETPALDCLEIQKISTNERTALNLLESSLEIPRFFQQNVKLIKTIGEGMISLRVVDSMTLGEL